MNILFSIGGRESDINNLSSLLIPPYPFWVTTSHFLWVNIKNSKNNNQSGLSPIPYSPIVPEVYFTSYDGGRIPLLQYISKHLLSMNLVDYLGCPTHSLPPIPYILGREQLVLMGNGHPIKSILKNNNYKKIKGKRSVAPECTT